MSNEIGIGDLVMIVRGAPCCGHTNGRLGGTYRVAYFVTLDILCHVCGTLGKDTFAGRGPGLIGVPIQCLKKIDPPSEGDSLPTRRELEVSA